MHRDSIASYVGHTGMLSYFAVAENEAVGRYDRGVCNIPI